MFLIQDGESKGSEQSGVGNDCEDRTRASTKENDNSKPESPFSTLVKMTTGKNPTTFSLPPELQCNTYFPGTFQRIIVVFKQLDLKLFLSEVDR